MGIGRNKGKPLQTPLYHTSVLLGKAVLSRIKFNYKMAHHHTISWVCHPYVWLVVCSGSPPWVLIQSGPNHKWKIQLPSYNKMSSVCIWESGLEPHWQGASFYKTIFISFSESVYLGRGGVILLPVNCIWEFFDLAYWKSQNCNLENCKSQLSCKLENGFQITCNL